MLTEKELLDRFDINLERGFLPKKDPFTAYAGKDNFSDSHIQAYKLDELATKIPSLLLTGTLRDVIDNFEVDFNIPDDDIVHDNEHRYFMRLLSFIGHAYIWGGEEPATVLPAWLAVAWSRAAKNVERPPILSYVSYAHDNWYRLDKDKGITLDNIALINNFLGGVDEEWFTTIHVAMEAQAGPAAINIAHAVGASKKGDIKFLDSCLLEVAVSVGNMYSTFCRMIEKCDPYIYYTRVRPFIFGTKNNPLTPNGVIYTGVDKEPRFYRGETGAQHSLIPALDGALGIKHKKDVLREYLMEMREYMPPKHRAFIEYCEQNTKIRALVGKHKTLQDSYNLLLSWMERLRTKHLEYANIYIHQQAQKASKTGSGGSTIIGTGGTPFMKYLRKHRDETASHKKS